MSYVEDDCTTCGKILPRKDFHTWDEDVVVARESGTTQRFANGAQGYREGKTTYRRVTRRLCPECWTEREEAMRLAAEAAAAKFLADRTRALIIGGVVGVVLIALIAWIALSGSPATSTNVVALPTTPATNELASTNATAPSPAPFLATIAFSVAGGGAPIVMGTTNLPDGTIMLVELRKPYPECYPHCLPFRPAGAKDTAEGGEVVVQQGRFTAGPTWSDAIDPTHDAGVPELPPATYILEVRSQLSEFQPPAVRAVIGDLAENMQGPLVDACCLGVGPEGAAMAAKERAGIEQAEPMAGHQVYLAQILAIAGSGAEASAEPDEAAVPPPPPGGLTLNAAVESALASGQATPWRDGADGGVVSVGEIQIWRERPCRTYGFTTNGVRSPVEIECRSPDSRWHPAGTYPNAVAPDGPD